MNIGSFWESVRNGSLANQFADRTEPHGDLIYSTRPDSLTLPEQVEIMPVKTSLPQNWQNVDDQFALHDTNLGSSQPK
jgi:hypothetical protein